MIPENILARLVRDPCIPAASRGAFVHTLKMDQAWRKLRESYPRRRISPSTACPSPDNLIFDCQHFETLPGKLVERPQESIDKSVTDVMANTKLLISFFNDCFDRNSIDGCGMTAISSVHFSRAHANAMWNGSQMVYGDGDGLIFKNMTSSDDFIGHELMHGITQYTAALEYEGEAGALNESLSDAFGSMFRQWKRGWDAGASDWTVGSDLMGPVAIQNGWLCLRDLRNPQSPSTLTKQPKHFRDYVRDGDPHDNSGIPNHAFYLACIEIGGRSWETVGKVWYGAITSNSINPKITFRDFARLTFHVGQRLFPNDKWISTKIQSAWKQVGVLP